MRTLRDIRDLKSRPLEDWTFKQKKHYDEFLHDLKHAIGTYGWRTYSMYLDGKRSREWMTERKLYFIKKILPLLVEDNNSDELDYYLKLHDLNDSLSISVEEEEGCHCDPADLFG